MLSSRAIAKLTSVSVHREAVFLYGIFKKITNHTHNTYASFGTSLESSNEGNSLNIVESPELPNWFTLCERQNSSNLDDDFVLPEIAKWANTKKLNSDHSKHVKHMVGEIIGSDVNRVAEVLKGQFESPNRVVYALSKYDPIDLSENFVENILLRFRHDWLPALGFFKWAKDQPGYTHTENCYNLMVDILGMSKEFELMWELVEEMRNLGGLISNVTMSKIMRRLCRAGKYDNAFQTLEKFSYFRLVKDVSVMNLLMDCLVKENNNVEFAKEVFVKLKDGITPDYHTFNILIHGFCKAKKYNDARKVMEEMENHGFFPDVVSYTCFIEYYCREKDFRKVDEILNEMEQKGCSPNAVTYTIIMLALGKAKQINESLEIYEKMKSNGCIPDSKFYSALISILSNSGRFKDAFGIFNDMPKQNVDPDVLTYNTMISCACYHSKEEYALQLLKEMEVNSILPNIETYTQLLKMCCIKKRMKVLKYLLNDMFNKNVSVGLSTYCLLVDRLSKSGKIALACSFFELMILKGIVPRYKTYSLLVDKLERQGLVEARQKIENLMSKAKVSLI